MKRLAREAVERECARFVWQVLDWNEPSIRFYESLGASVLKEWLTVRMDGEALERLAALA
jgi:RimJ/RimL family protein N-acetyltransferase